LRLSSRADCRIEPGSPKGFFHLLGVKGIAGFLYIRKFQEPRGIRFDPSDSWQNRKKVADAADLLDRRSGAELPRFPVFPEIPDFKRAEHSFPRKKSSSRSSQSLYFRTVPSGQVPRFGVADEGVAR